MKLPKSYLIKAFLIVSALILVVSSTGYCAQKNISAIPYLLLFDTQCSPENCTEDQWDDIFVRAITELDAEGLVITPQTISSDIVVYLAIFDRMLSIVGLEEAEEQKLNMALEAYDDKIIYCGPGNSKTNPQFYGKQPQLTGDCLNTACWAHDNCYDTIDGLSEGCLWSKTTKDCDDIFFLIYETCKELKECGAQCELANTIARNLRDIDCVNNYFVSWSDKCKERLAGCPDCTPKSVKDSCDAMGAECGTTINGCGETIECGGSCIEGKWSQYGYNATIEGSGFSYTLTGTGDGNFKHTGTITWNSTDNWYEGNLADVEGFCCGNIGYIWIKVKDENFLSIKSRWTTPDGTLVKDNTDVWTDMYLVSRDVD